MTVRRMPPGTRPTGEEPTHCPHGHPLGPGQVLVGWSPCSCPGAAFGGHRTFRCRACIDGGEEMVMYRPEHLDERGPGHQPGATPYPQPL